MESQMQGVQRDAGLGMRYGAPPAPMAKAVRQVADEWESRFESLEVEHAKAMEEVDRLHDAAMRLYAALVDVLPKTCASHLPGEGPGCPECCAIELRETMAEFAQPVDKPSCPECRSGKHQNCDGQAWDAVKDEPTSCACAEEGHSD